MVSHEAGTSCHADTQLSLTSALRGDYDPTLHLPPRKSVRAHAVQAQPRCAVS